MGSTASLVVRAGGGRWRWWGVLAVCALSADVVAAAGYKELPVDPPTLRGWRKLASSPLRSEVINMLAGLAPLNVDNFDKFFNDQMFPQFTLIKENVVVPPADLKDSREGGSVLPKCRREFVQQFISAAKDKTAFDRLNQLTVKTMGDIALDNYHPLSRYTAVMVLASLHEWDDPSLPRREEAKPLAAAFPRLLSCLESIDVVKVAALNALTRHVKAEIDAEQRSRLIPALLKLVADKKVAPSSTLSGHDWIRRQAIELLVLAAQSEPAAQKATAAALDAILQDSGSSLELCCAAAKGLGGLRLNGLDPAVTAYSIGQVAVDAYKAELARAELLSLEMTAPPTPSQGGIMPAGRGQGPAIGGPGLPGAGLGGVAAPAASEEQQFISVQLLKSQLACLQQGLRGPSGKGGGVLAAAAGTPAEKFVTDVDGKLDALILACNNNVPSYLTLKTQIKTAGDALDALLAGHPTPKARSAAIPAAAAPAGPVGDFGEPAAKPAAGKAAP